MALKYKVGDKVRIKSLDWYNENIAKNKKKYPPEEFDGIHNFFGKIVTISDAVDSPHVDFPYYNIVEDEWEYYYTDEMIECKVEEEEIEFTEEDKYWCDIMSESDPTTYVLPQGYQFVDENGNVIETKKIVLEKKKSKYPQSYEECCEVLGDVRSACWSGYKCDILGYLNKLLICRDAYWKITGEEWKLKYPWHPKWDRTDIIHYIITYAAGEIYKDISIQLNYIFAFPTAEMRDTFYENFKELIEQCKELL